MGFLDELTRSVRAYADHPDPLTASANTIALLVASNQPFYPLYLWWLVGENAWPSLYTLLSTPFFLAVPAVARRSTIAGRALLPLAGIGNTILSAKALGVESGVEIFLIPCALIALVVYRPRERISGLVIAGLAFATFLALHGNYGTPIASFTGDEYRTLLRLNAVSAAALTCFVALVISNVLAALEASAKSAGSDKPG